MDSSNGNLAQVVQLIWTEGEISRAQVARRLDLSRSTVSALVQQLIDQGSVIEARVGRSSGGRPPVMLRFAHQRYHLVGLDIGMTHVAVLLMDARGAVLARGSRRHATPHDPEGTLDVAHAMLEEVLTIAPEGSTLLGIGVAAPCPVHPSRPGGFSPSILPAWKDVDVAAALSARHGAPVYVENDANLGALGELVWGQGRDVSDFVYVKLATGVGAGLIVRGEVYRGSDGIAGEIGHTSIDISGPPCGCGLHGCLVTLIGSEALEGAYERLQPGTNAHLGEIAEAAAQGETEAVEVVEAAARSLGVGLANLLNLVNPARIVLGGRLTLAGDALVQPLQQAIAGRALWTNVDAADIVISDIGDDVIPMGAATLVLRTALADPRRLATGLPTVLPHRPVAAAAGPHPTP